MTTDKDRSFHPILLDSLRLDTVTDFDIYLKVDEAPGGEKYVLYRTKSIVFTERARQNLLEHGREHLFIRIEDRKEYHRYLEKNLHDILNDQSVPVKERSEMVYACATALVEELLENPRSAEYIRRSKTIISNLAGYLFTESRAFFSLIASTSFDYYTYTHSVNVAIFGMALAHKLGWYDLQEINIIGSGLILHDVGKSLIDRKILNKKEPLNRDEWTIIKQHPENGVRILKDLGELHEEALVIVHGHHEKLDGSGYPQGLRGDAVHPYARIAAVADVFDALTTRRPYRLAEKTFSALRIMRDEMHGAFDQHLFREFVTLLGPTEPAEILKNLKPDR